MPAHTEPYANVLETIGWTPLIRLNKLTQGIRTPLYAKAEFFNPGGSVKDRIGLAMIEAAEREGRLRPGGLIVEATSGNTGVGLALAAAVKGYRCIFTMPDKMSQEKARLLHALGAEVIITPTAVPPDHPENYIVKGRAIAAAHPNAIFADQHYNPVNPDVHYRTTGPELWTQTAGKLTHFVCAPGTGGTVSGAGRYLKERNPKVRVIAGDPVGSIYKEYAATHVKGEGAPYIEPDESACVMCTPLSCMHNCPSGALLPIVADFIDMGVAQWHESTCLRSAGEDCTICVDVCPVGARALLVDDMKISVREGCTGCGQCQHACPTRPKSITVLPKSAR